MIIITNEYIKETKNSLKVYAGHYEKLVKRKNETRVMDEFTKYRFCKILDNFLETELSYYSFTECADDGHFEAWLEVQLLEISKTLSRLNCDIDVNNLLDTYCLDKNKAMQLILDNTKR